MPTYFITGATGKQGGALAYALLSSGHQVHALTRDPSSEASKNLASSGAILFQGDFSSTEAMQRAATGCVGAFLNVMPSMASPTGELDDARNIIQACLAAGVKHVIYSSVLLTGRHEEFPTWGRGKGGFMEHFWVSKDAVEKEVRGARLEAWTILRVGVFMTNFVLPSSAFMYPELASRGIFKSAYKPETKIELVAPGDVGRVAARVFEEPGKWGGKAVDVVGEVLSVRDIVRILGEVGGKEISMDEIGEGDDVSGWRSESQRWQVEIERTGKFRSDSGSIKEMGIQMTGFKEFLEGETVLGKS
jgi:uncharacterized protein YbjT (DUF2867 family)